MKITTTLLKNTKTESRAEGKENLVHTEYLPGNLMNPAELLASALGACMLTMMDSASHKHNDDLTGTRLDITLVMQENPSRVGEFFVDVTFPKGITRERQEQYVQTAKACPVHNSLNKDIFFTVNIK